MTLHKAFDGEVYYWWDDDRQQASRVRPEKGRRIVPNGKDKTTAKRIIKRYLDNDTNDYQFENEFIAALTAARKDARAAAFTEIGVEIRRYGPNIRKVDLMARFQELFRKSEAAVST